MISYTDKNKLSDIKVLFIDIDGTLLDFDLSAKAAISEAAGELGIALGDGFFDTFTSVNDGLWERVERKEMTKDELFHMRWDIIFDKAGVSRNIGGYDFELVFKKHLFFTAVPVDGAKEILDYLVKKYPLYIASNSSRGQQESRMRAAGLDGYFKKMFISDEIGAEKPSGDFFEYCLTNAGGIRPSEAVMIGDSLTADIKGGNDAGIVTIHLNRKARKYTDTLPDYSVISLSEIKEIL